MSAQSSTPSAISVISQPLTLPCGLVLPNRLVKCPMQETLAVAPYYDPPVSKFAHLYNKWACSNYGLIITGQVQVDSRFLSVPGDVVTHPKSLKSPHFEQWVEWAKLSKQNGTPSIVQLAHPGRMSPAGAGNRPADMQTLCPSSVPVQLGDSWLDKLAVNSILGVPQAMSIAQIEEVISMFKHGARVVHAAGFDGIQIHGAHGFLLSQFLSPRTNQRSDKYGGSPEKRMKLLKRLVSEIRDLCPRPFCLAVKLNSADYMTHGGLEQPEGLEQVRWLANCGMVDLIEISGGNAETATSKLHTSFGEKSLEKAPVRESTRIREGFYTEFAEKVQAMKSPVPIQLSGGFRSRVGMADAVESGICDLIGLGRTTVLQPDLPKSVILNESVADRDALAVSHIVRGQWFVKLVPVKVVGSGLSIQFFYHNMRRLGNGLAPDLGLSIPVMIFREGIEKVREALRGILDGLLSKVTSLWKREKLE